MSTLRVSTIQDTAGSNSSTPAAIANGIAKAWVNFNGTGVVAIRAQYNVSSITDNGTGLYTVNFTTALADANYCPTLAIQSRAGSNDTLNYIFNTLSGGVATTTPAAGSYTILTNQYDPAYVCTAVFR